MSRPAARAVAYFEHGPCVLDGETLHCDDQQIYGVADAHRDCVTHSDGSASCLGTNRTGELGDGRPTFAATPQRVPDLDDVVDLRVAHTTVCALRRDRSLTCWGWAPRATLGTAGGPLGRGDTPGCWIASGALHCYDSAPLQPGAWKPLARVALGYRGAIKSFAISGTLVCVIDAAATLACRANVWEPEDSQPWTKVAVGVAEIDDSYRGFALRFTDGRIGMLDFDDDDGRYAVRAVPGIGDATRLASGNDEACAIRKGGEVACWKFDPAEPDAPPEVTTIPAFRGATAIAAHAYHKCAIVRDELWCAGRNLYGQLGIGTRAEPLHEVEPVRVTSAIRAVQVGVTEEATCALDKAGHVWCFGSDEYGELGTGRLPHRNTLGKVVGIGPRAPLPIR